ncbi:putative rRNA maturation factor YbeY [Blochmannia endosymbiont of Polyrhachis (Hedomyrma) turneri]|nr:putative rRNA maturation factor YbeY [Blochmannia endosymbiont of Polyrhachis (Hedomyrma) turneri]
MKKIVLNLQLACNNLNGIPNKSTFTRWIRCIFSSYHRKCIELSIRIVDEMESRSLNMYFLKKKNPTNVLSFPFYPPLWLNTTIIGDLVICYQIIKHEAKINNISIERQLAYVVIHGSLHLMGYDHITTNDTEIMEKMEKKIMYNLGYR